MGQKDLTEKNLEFYPDVFADIVNALLYKGEGVVQEKELQAAPTETLYTGKKRLRNQFHDVSKYEMKCGEIRVQYTLENETSAKRKMVLRKAGYEGAVYREQYDGKEIFPFVSLVLFWGKRHWSAPKSLAQLWKKDTRDERWREYVDDISLHVYEMANLPEVIRQRFKSDMRIVVDYLAEGKNYVPSKQRIEHVEALLLMLKELTQDERYEEIISSLREEERETGGMSMCELLDKYENRGLERGISQGISQGKIETLLQNIQALMRNMKVTAEEAMKILDVPVEERAEYLAKL